MIEIPLPKVLPSPNSRLHWAERYRLAKELKMVTTAIARTAINSGDMPKAGGNFVTLDLVLIRGKGQKMLDYDNMVAGLKPCVDGLVAAGVAMNDNEKWLKIRYDQTRGEHPVLGVGVVE